MDPLHFCIAVGPLAVYFLLLGVLNISSRPFLTTGARDAAALGVAVSGFAVAGPMELFLPGTAAARFGGLVWLLLLALYGLCLTLWVLLMRPRIVIYNVTSDRLRSILADVVTEVDKQARWAGECLVLPQLGVQLHVETTPVLRNAQLVASGPNQNYIGWRQLEVVLGRALRKAPGSRNPCGYFLIMFGLVIVSGISYWLVNDREALAQALNEMLRR